MSFAHNKCVHWCISTKFFHLNVTLLEILVLETPHQYLRKTTFTFFIPLCFAKPPPGCFKNTRYIKLWLTRCHWEENSRQVWRGQMLMPWSQLLGCPVGSAGSMVSKWVLTSGLFHPNIPHVQVSYKLQPTYT